MYSGEKEERLMTERGHEGLWDTGSALIGLGAGIFSLKIQWAIYTDDMCTLWYVNHTSIKR